ncbi:MAG: DUF1772 domain-containing protein [Thermoplasmata archaeon]
MLLENATLVLAGTLTALIAGLLFGYAVSVNGGLHRLKDSEYVAAMQSINIVIVRPVFLLAFFGPVILLPLAAYLYLGISASGFALLLLASVLYIGATFGVTVAGNVPLNNRLAGVDLSRASDEEVGQARAQYERPWNRLHAVPTFASVAATVAIFVAAVTS